MMKTQFRILLFLSALAMCLPDGSFAQPGKGKGPPPWAPAHGYRAKTRHIYFPEYNVYFDIQRGVYIFLRAGSWTVAAKLPSTFGSGNLKGSVQIELDLNSDSPQKFNADHLVKYKVKKDKSANPGKGKGKKRK